MRKILCARIDAFDALLNRMKNIISRTVGQSRHVTPNRTIRIRLSNPFFFLCKLKKNKRDRNKHKILIHKIPIAFISVCPNKNAPYINTLCLSTMKIKLILRGIFYEGQRSQQFLLQQFVTIDDFLFSLYSRLDDTANFNRS